MTLGAIYVGGTIAAMLFGISNLQIVIYYKNYPNDSWIYRYSVAIIWILDALHVALSTHAVYHYLIDSFGNYPGLYHIVWSFKLQLLICMVMIIWVEAYVSTIPKVSSYSHSGVLYPGYTRSDSGNVCTFKLPPHHPKIKLTRLLVGGHYNRTLSWIVVLTVAIALGSGICTPYPISY
ncbi:hypothetical protein F5146DRAFT_1225092 [Armillaria mellea]|nr:hypothetical protein F5146DRAFT_1225092 [Armillaria mellea]